MPVDVTCAVRSIAATRTRRRALRLSILGALAVLAVAAVLVAQSVNAFDAAADG